MTTDTIDTRLEALLLWNGATKDGEEEGIKMRDKLNKILEIRKNERDRDIQNLISMDLYSVDLHRRTRKEIETKFSMFRELVEGWDVSFITSPKNDTVKKRREAIINYYG